MEAKLKLITAVVSLMAVTLISTMGLAYFEHWSMFDALWVTLVSITTTGYGDIVPMTAGGRAFLLTILLAGVGIVTYSLMTIITILVEGQVRRVMERDKVMKEIAKLENHIIVCGAGRVGASVAQVLKGERIPFVLIDHDQEIIDALESENYLVVHGDATQDEVLLSLGLKRARGIVCALPEDAFNLFITLSARDMNPGLKIVSRAERPETIQKLLRAGADKVISPTQIGGYQLAMAMVKPVTVDMVDTLFTSSNQQLQLEEMHITSSSSLVDHPIRSAFGNDRKVTIIAIIRANEVLMNIRGDDHIRAGDTLILVGPRSELEKIESASAM
ncbi:potassium channel family protein [Syntrophomonas palmitatica]|uniref:potassium channel family protein n=1 Tax=Syntrophomonas palmitatica TaxID=402877 RepID=UPI0006D157F6|nr:potassium channel protein [Syntrophomonas palmitatica]